MGFRFQRRISIIPGITANISKSGISTSFGVTGARITVGRGRIRRTVGIPGTGLSYSTITHDRGRERTPPDVKANAIILLVFLGILVAIFAPIQNTLALAAVIGLAVVLYRTMKSSAGITSAPSASLVANEETIPPTVDVAPSTPFPFHLANLRGADGYYHITYRAADGTETTRDIHAKRVYEFEGEFAIEAHCFLRNAHRRFLNRSVISATDQETNVQVPNLAEAAMAKFSQTPEGEIEEAGIALQEYSSLIDALTFVSRADGRMLPPERAIIADAFVEASGTTISAKALSMALKVWEEPDIAEFRAILKGMRNANDVATLTLLQKAAHAIVATQSTVSPWESAATAEIDATVSQLA